MESILKPKHAIVVVAGIYFELSNSSMIFCAKERLVHHKLTVQKMHEIAQTVSKKSKKINFNFITKRVLTKIIKICE
jgi:hypothetical protein